MVSTVATLGIRSPAGVGLYTHSGRRGRWVVLPTRLGYAVASARLQRLDPRALFAVGWTKLTNA